MHSTRFVRWVAKILVLASLLAVTVLPQAQAKPTQKTIVLKFWAHVFAPMNKYNVVLARQYERLNPGVKIQLQTFPFGDFGTKLLTAAAGGAGPDVFDLFDPFFPEFVKDGIIAPVDLKAFGFSSYAEMEHHWLKGSLNGFTLNGKVYGIPMEFDTFALFINTKEYRAAGLNPNKDYPRTWTQLINNARKLTIRKNGKLVQEGFDWGYVNPFWMTIDFYPLLRQEGGDLLNKNGTRAEINSPAAIRALTLYRDVIKKYHTGDPAVGLSSDANPNADFASGEVAQWLTGPWAFPTLQNQPVWGHIKVVPLPQVDPAHPVSALYSLGWVVNAHSPNQAAAWKFVDWLSRHQTGWLKNAGYIQPRLGYFHTKIARATPFLNVWIANYKMGEYLPRNVHLLEIASALKDMMDRVVKGNTNPKSSADQAETAINDILSG
jgi:multiple sugar transport system substrate-binding protein